MKKTRKIIKIDEEKCTGCGQCIIKCAEGALILVDGKARLMSDVYCDGLGACLGECPEGALEIIEREADDFDETSVEELLKDKESEKHKTHQDKLPCGCPSSQTMTLKHDKTSKIQSEDIGSELSHWPIQLQLLNPNAPFLKDSDLLLLADCTAVAFPNLHTKLLRNHTIAMGCPKLDNLDTHIDRLADILKIAKPKSLTVIYMEVPCCRGFVYAAQEALNRSGVNIPLKIKMIGRTGEILEEETLNG
jgi:Pyruvate/2-oxoacid:ferredoxin oxidoreductase delta subunit